MVLVEPVAAVDDASRDASPMHQSDSDAAAGVTSAAFEDADGLFDEPQKATVPEAPTHKTRAKKASAVISPDLIDTVEDLSVQAEVGHKERTHAEPASDWHGTPSDCDESDGESAAQLSPPPRPIGDDVLLPNADWTSASTIQWRNRVLTGIAAVVGIVLAMLLIVAFSGDGESPDVALRPSTSIDDPVTETTPDQPQVPATDPTEEPRTATSDVPAEETSPALSPAETEPEELTDRPVPEPEVVPKPTATAPDPTPAPDEPIGPDSPADEPPGMTPKEPIAAATDSVPSPLSETLRDFGALLDETKEPATPMPAAETELPPTPEVDGADGDPVARRTGPRVVQLDDRMNDPIRQIEFDRVPLENFLKFVSDYSTIPITLDADILRWLRISPVTPVTVKAANSTVAEVLNQGLAPLGLDHRVEGDQLLITRRPKEESGIRTVTFKVDDLVGDDQKQLQQLGNHIMDFVAPESWSSRGGIGTITFRGSELIIEQYETVQFEILGFCEKLRVARSLKLRSPYDASMFPVTTRSDLAREKLSTPIKLTYIRPAPLQRIVDRLAQASKLHILIDWRALAAADWSPDAEVRFSVADQPLTKALTELLEPMDLAYRIIDGSTLQITTPEVLDSHLEIEFYRVAKPTDEGTAIMQAARDALGPPNFRDFGGSGQVAFDAPSNCLLVCLSQPRQVELQAWLASRAVAVTSSKPSDVTTPTATVGSRIVPASGPASND